VHVDARKLRQAILVADLIWAAIALIIGFAMRYGFGGLQLLWRPFSVFGAEFVACIILWITLQEWMKLDSFRGGWRLPAVISRVFLGVVTMMAILLAGAYLARDLVSRLVLSYFGVLFFVGLVGIRCTAHLVFVSTFAQAASRKVVIAGSSRVARELGTKISRHPETFCRVVGYLAPYDAYTGSPDGRGSASAQTVNTLGIVDLLKAQHVDELILVDTSCTHPEVLRLAAGCRDEGIQVSLVPELYELYLSRPTLMDLDGLPVLQLPEPRGLAATGIKRTMDLVIGGFLTLAAAPLVFIAATLLALEKGHAFRRETRCGQRGQHFGMFRLNTSRNAPDQTVLDRTLEKFSITELPQLWNVLKGEMSLVGPRPEDPARVGRYTEWEKQRLRAKPGITGLAQVHGLREEHSSEDKCRFDLQYLLDYSLILDISLLLQTVWTLVSRPSRRVSSGTNPAIRMPLKDPRFLEEMVSAHRTQPGSD
jgi:lipopolysaccharide/colanic/teichoic acid biosynthesis glycosyltransferase